MGRISVHSVEDSSRKRRSRIGRVFAATMALEAFQRMSVEVDKLLEQGTNNHERGEFRTSIQKFIKARDIIDKNLGSFASRKRDRSKHNRPRTASARLEARSDSCSGGQHNVTWKSARLEAMKRTYLPVLENVDGSSIQERSLDAMKAHYLPVISMQQEEEEFILNNPSWRRELQLKCTVAEGALAALELNKAEDEKAEKRLLKVLQSQQNIMAEEGIRNHQTIATTLHNLGCLRASQNKMEDAEKYFTRALQMRKVSCGGSDHVDIAESLNDLGCCRLSMGKVPAKDCEKDLLRALEMRQKLLPKTHALITESKCNIAVCKLKYGDRSGALDTMREGLALRTRSRDISGIIDCSIALAEMYGRDKHLYHEAFDLLRNSLWMFQDFKGDDHHGAASIMHKLMRLSYAHQHYSAAKDWGTRAIETCMIVPTSLTRAYRHAIETDLRLVDMRLEAKRLHQERLELARRMAEGRAEVSSPRKGKRRGRGCRERGKSRRRSPNGRRKKGSRSRSPSRSASKSPTRSKSPKYGRRPNTARPYRRGGETISTSRVRRRPETAHGTRRLPKARTKTTEKSIKRAKTAPRIRNRSREELDGPSTTLSAWSSISSIASHACPVKPKKNPGATKKNLFSIDARTAAKRFKLAEEKRAAEEKVEHKKKLRELRKQKKNVLKTPSASLSMIISGPPKCSFSNLLPIRRKEGGAVFSSEAFLAQWDE